MFSFFKDAVEKDLIKLGFSQLIKGYKQKLKSKEITKEQYKNALKELHNKHFNQINNLGNINVATRQTFDDDELMVPLNLQNIQDEFIDIDFLYSSLLFEYNSHQRVHTRALTELENLLHQQFPNATILPDDLSKIEEFDLKTLINEATLPIDPSSQNYLKAIFTELRNRL